MDTITRRAFIRRSTAAGGSLVGMGALHAYGARVAAGQAPGASAGYGPLVPKAAQNDPAQMLRLPAAFNFEVVSRQGLPMSDGNPTPGIFDGTGSFATDRDDVTILIRNHENRRRPGEIPVIVPADKRYDPDPTYDGGDTKLIVERRRAGRNPDRTPRYTYRVLRDFAILGGTDTNCAGGVVGDSWYTCEEVVNRSAAGLKHGYNFVIPAYADGPVQAVPQPEQGRFVHEAVAELDGVLYETEDRGITADPAAPAITGRPDRKPVIGAVLYRFFLDDDRREGGARLQALKLRDEFHADMNAGRAVGQPYRVEWVDVDDPDHDDDTDTRLDRVLGLIPTRVQAQDKGAAFFQRQEGIWTAGANGRGKDKVYFDCTSGGAAGSGQVWELDPRRQTIMLIFESPGAAVLDAPDNVVIVPRTGDILLQEDGGADQFIRGVTAEGGIYDFAQTVTNDSEFCGGCFDAGGRTLFVSQQGDRSGTNPPGQPNNGVLEGTPSTRALTYAIYGPFEARGGRRGRDG
jgi:secreted PhoX family phosphatase